MPTIIQAKNTRLNRQGEGWTEITLADEESFGKPAMVARRLSLNPYAIGPQEVHGDAEQLLYVIAGSGEVVVDGEPLALAPETMLWLEPGDRYRFEAGPDGLEILQGFATGE